MAGCAIPKAPGDSSRFSVIIPNMWVWERKGWPDWRYELSDWSRAAAELQATGSSLLESIDGLPAISASEVRANVLATEIRASMSIEGMRIDPESALQAARGTVAAQPGLKFMVLDRRAEGIAQAIWDARAGWDRPLTVSRLCAWQHAILEAAPSPGVALGRFRSGEVRVQEADGTVRYQAPPAERLEAEVVRFLDWFAASRGELPGPLRAGIAHAWFELLHPFGDGNGRVGRAVADLALSQGLGGPQPGLLAASVENHCLDYYRHLEALGRKNDRLTHWLAWWMETVGSAFHRAQAFLDRS